MLNQEQKDFIAEMIQENKNNGEPLDKGIVGWMFPLKGMNDYYKTHGSTLLEDVGQYLINIASKRTMEISYLTDEEYDIVYKMLEELEMENKIGNFNVGG